MNILHSHGTLDADVQVDAILYDNNGACVAQRRAWRIASRHGLARADVAELLPDPLSTFKGHIALSFAPEKRAAVPRHLQALMEYRRSSSVAHVMTWSDEWNSRISLARRDRSATLLCYRSYFRMLPDSHAITEFSITNAGHVGYDRTADIRAVYIGSDGSRMETDFKLLPFATRFTTLSQLFAAVLSEHQPVSEGVLLLESTSDLASIGFTTHPDGRSLAAEHFLWLASEHEGEYLLPAGS